MTTNEARKQELIRRIDEVVIEAKVYTAANLLQGRELALAITKLEEAQMWAQRIHPRTVGDDGEG